MNNQDNEIQAIGIILNALKPLEQESAQRAMKYVCDRLGIVVATGQNAKAIPVGAPDGSSMADSTFPAKGNSGPFDQFETLADAFSAAGPPKSGADKALLVAAFVQTKSSPNGFVTRQISDELKHLGHPLSNIADTLTKILEKRPQPMTQIRKSGSSKQAQKTFKVTTEGMKTVAEMFRGKQEGL